MSLFDTLVICFAVSYLLYKLHRRSMDKHFLNVVVPFTWDSQVAKYMEAKGLDEIDIRYFVEQAANEKALDELQKGEERYGY